MTDIMNDCMNICRQYQTKLSPHTNLFHGLCMKLVFFSLIVFLQSKLSF